MQVHRADQVAREISTKPRYCQDDVHRVHPFLPYQQDEQTASKTGKQFAPTGSAQPSQVREGSEETRWNVST